MKQYFDFIYYGLNCSVTSESSFFIRLITQKFQGYATFKTHHFENNPVSIEFSEKEYTVPNLATKLSGTSWKTESSLIIKHFYLGSTTYCVFTFENRKVIKIKLYYSHSVTFVVLNVISINTLRRQLFQQLIKLYIEQSLLWSLCKEHNLLCFHAAAFERNGKVLIYAGANGVGKSTYVQQIMKTKRTKQFADNYILVDKKYSYFSPDSVRLDKQSMRWLHKKSTSSFGFNKYTLEQKKGTFSSLLKAEVNAVFLVSLGNNEKIRKTTLEKIISFQVLSGEEVTYAPIAQYDPTLPNLDNAPDCKYYQKILSLRK